MVTTDSLGNWIWSKTYDEANHSDFALAVDPAANTDLIVSGFNKVIGEGGGTYIMRLDIAGNLLLYRTFRNFQGSNSMEELLPSGDIILAGFADDFTGQSDAGLLRTSGIAAPIWAMAYGGAVFDTGEAVAPTANGFALIGWTQSFGFGLSDFYFVKTDMLGQSGCNEFVQPLELSGSNPPPLDIDLLQVPLDIFQTLPIAQNDITFPPQDLCPSCPWDLDGNGLVGTSDLLMLLARWGVAAGNPADFDGDGFVGTSDLLKLLANWGAC